MTSNFTKLLPADRRSKICLVCDSFSDFAEHFAEFVNICVERHLVIERVENPDRFEWEMDNGEIAEISNARRNKAIFHLAPLPPPLIVTDPPHTCP